MNEIGWDGNEPVVYRSRFRALTGSLSRQVRELVAGRDEHQDRAIFTRRVNGGFQCSMLADVSGGSGATTRRGAWCNCTGLLPGTTPQ